MFPSWRSLLSWKPIRVSTRLANDIQPNEIIDLTKKDNVEKSPEVAEAKPEYNCPICILPLEEPVATNCGHVFCAECLEFHRKRSADCPLCKRDILHTLRLYL